MNVMKDHQARDWLLSKEKGITQRKTICIVRNPARGRVWFPRQDYFRQRHMSGSVSRYNQHIVKVHLYSNTNAPCKIISKILSILLYRDIAWPSPKCLTVCLIPQQVLQPMRSSLQWLVTIQGIHWEHVVSYFSPFSTVI